MITTQWYGANFTRADKLPSLNKILAPTSAEHARRAQLELANKVRHHLRLAAAQLNGDGS